MVVSNRLPTFRSHSKTACNMADRLANLFYVYISLVPNSVKVRIGNNIKAFTADKHSRTTWFNLSYLWPWDMCYMTMLAHKTLNGLREPLDTGVAFNRPIWNWLGKALWGLMFSSRRLLADMMINFDNTVNIDRRWRIITQFLSAHNNIKYVFILIEVECQYQLIM